MYWTIGDIVHDGTIQIVDTVERTDWDGEKDKDDSSKDGGKEAFDPTVKMGEVAKVDESDHEEIEEVVPARVDEDTKVVTC